MSDLVVWVDGQVVASDAATVRAHDHGLTVGDGVFETLKVVDGQAFALTRHLRRLSRSASGLGLPEPDADRVREGVRAVLDARPPLRLGRLRVTMTGGAGPLGSDRGGASPTYLVLLSVAQPAAASTTVTAVPWTRNERSAVAGLKTTSYAENVVALAWARERGATEALMANTRGELCEGTGSNVFLAREGRLLTPPLTSGCLAGVTRELLIEWALADGWAVDESPLPMEALDVADEVMLTSSTRDVQAVHAVGSRQVVPGPVTRRAQALFSARAADDVDP